MAPEAGLQPVPGYRLTRPLGAGSFGEVWEAERDDGTRAALKFLDCRSRPALIASEVRVLRGLAELKHPHIIDLHTVHASGRYMILVMELADGNLADLQAAYQRQAGTDVPPDHALELLEQAAVALDFLATARVPSVSSTRGLQHCDIKPTNLLLVGNKLKPWTNVSQQALDLLQQWPYPLVAQLRDSQGYVVTTALGKSLFDYHSVQVREHQADWQPLLKWLKK